MSVCREHGVGLMDALPLPVNIAIVVGMWNVPSSLLI